ncbi:SEL1-like repeat protein [Burkholderia cepacia]|uniref:SEL1-like repeat protein n=1 Tax=Burkholderia cepacia TaxID=292 RepID=UPI001D008F7C|nr:sel1 repeat family protein [Burkholderia cepacia]MDN7900500.1 sel1 repeat family protein [Burkholderia cepacia]
MKRTIAMAICATLTLSACSKKDDPMSSQADMSAVRAKLSFTCVREVDHLPPLDPQADAVFKYALYLEKKDGANDYDLIARYYRIAAAHGHYKANHNLQLLVSEGYAHSPDAQKETIDLVEQLIAAGIPGGYYDMGHYLELGYGVKKDENKARVFFRKAADLGSPEAQYYVGDLLSPKDRAPDISRKMLDCAANQGYGKAASYLGMDLSTAKSYPDAVIAFQNGVQAGDEQAARFLANGFDSNPSDPLYFLALSRDPERSRRYKSIAQFISDNDGRNPKVPDIDKIVPLPPAKLPPWDGTFQWQKEQNAAVSPQKPSDEVIDQMAKAKNLDPATGLPLANPVGKTSQEDQPAKIATRLPLGTFSHTGQQCPEDGVWCAKLDAGQIGDTKRRFLKGDALPSVVVHEPRRLAVLDSMLGTRQRMTSVTWELVAYLDQA